MPSEVVQAATRILGHPPESIEPLEGRTSVVAMRRPDGTEAVVKWGDDRRIALNEWAALALLRDLDLHPRIAPALLGGDAEAGVVVMERLAPAPSLAGLLLGTDGDAARAGLIALGRALGRLHAVTLDHLAEYQAIRAALGVPTARHSAVAGQDVWLLCLRRWCEALGLCLGPGVADDLEWVRRSMSRPGRFEALIHGDACPDNNRVYDDGAVLLDFQAAGADHCLLDAASFTVPFPTCWCVADIGPDDVSPAEAAYRAALSASLPEIIDDKVWWARMAEVAAWWLMDSLSLSLVPALAADETWGTVTIRQRAVLRSARFAALARRADHLPALADLADHLVVTLRSRWPDLGPAPAYPALAVPGAPVVSTPSWWEPAW